MSDANSSPPCRRPRRAAVSARGKILNAAQRRNRQQGLRGRLHQHHHRGGRRRPGDLLSLLPQQGGRPARAGVAHGPAAAPTPDLGDRGRPQPARGRAPRLARIPEFVRANPDLYRVVAEAQFVEPEVFQRYYQDFAASYRAGLLAAEARGEIAPGDAEVRAWALMGISDMVGRRFALWDSASVAAQDCRGCPRPDPGGTGAARPVTARHSLSPVPRHEDRRCRGGSKHRASILIAWRPASRYQAF